MFHFKGDAYGPCCDRYAAQPLRVFVQASHHYREEDMGYFTYDQNNSGGTFDHDADAGIGYNVVVEAGDWEEADRRAQAIGLYFNGCDYGMDCPCCGDRWYSARGDKPDPEPMAYGKPITGGGWGLPTYIHHKGGRIEVRGEVIT